MNWDHLVARLPQIVAWLAATRAHVAPLARPVAELGSVRLAAFFAPALLARARVAVVPALPDFPHGPLGLPELAPIGRSEDRGFTLGDLYCVTPAAATEERIHAHELIHVVQWDALGTERFLLDYTAGLVARGYAAAPLEKMASDFESYFERRGAPFDAPAWVRSQLDPLRPAREA